MGNNCVGPSAGNNGFLQSVTKAMWNTRQPETLPPPSKEQEASGNKDTNNKAEPEKSDSSNKRGAGSSSTNSDIQSTPPAPVKMPEMEKVEKVEKVEKAEKVENNNSTTSGGEGKQNNNNPNNQNQNQNHNHNNHNHNNDNNNHNNHSNHHHHHNNNNHNNHHNNKPGHRRLSSVGLQIDSVLQRKTRNLKEIYTLGRTLGQGQYGTTFFCLEKVTGKEFACKSIAKRKLTTQEDVEDVRREIQIMHHLAGHPNMIQIVGAYEDAVAVHLVMELCAGGELFDRIVQRGHYTERKAAELTRVIVGVIEACHSLGVMHRDLKPENFLFADEEEEAVLKTIDFGLSVFFKPGQIFTDVVGSPYYVAPEVLRKHYGQECDIWSAGVIVYILLSGVPPFWDESEQGIFEQVLKGKLDFVSEPWPGISESAKDLIRKMLLRDPKQRPTAHEVLCHPWVQVDGGAPDRPLDSAVLSRLKQFSAMNKLKKMAIRVIAESLSEEEIAGLKEMFKMIDVDNSGHITLEELKNGLEKVGANLQESEILDLMKAADVDNSGTLDYGEFVAAMLNLNKIQKEDNMYAAFQYFDQDGSGYITKDELKQACEKFGLHDVHLDDIIREVDQDNDGHIDYNEFVAMMQDTDFGKRVQK